MKLVDIMLENKREHVRYIKAKKEMCDQVVSDEQTDGVSTGVPLFMLDFVKARLLNIINSLS